MMEAGRIGNHNSSITRVRPFFQQLLSNDPTGRLWIPSLLSEATLNQDLAPTLVDDADDRGIWLQPYQRWVDRELRQWFGVEVEYEACFEFLLAPPNNLLVWLLNHPEQLVPRDDWRKSMRNQDHILLREQLLGEHGETAQMQAKRLATEALNRYGVEKSDKRWWAFEGFTKVDCLLETQKTVFVFEGKRTEPQSPAVSWLPRRNQVIRNIEAAQQYAAAQNKLYAVMLMVEQNAEVEQRAVLDSLDGSLPHLSPNERQELIGHFLGCITWREACEATSPYSDWDSLPDMVRDVVARWRTRNP